MLKITAWLWRRLDVERFCFLALWTENAVWDFMPSTLTREEMTGPASAARRRTSSTKPATQRASVPRTCFPMSGEKDSNCKHTWHDMGHKEVRVLTCPSAPAGIFSDSRSLDCAIGWRFRIGACEAAELVIGFHALIVWLNHYNLYLDKEADCEKIFRK